MIRRVPIKVKRTPINLPAHIKPQVKLWEVMELTREDDIHELTEHYNMLVMNATGKTGYSCVSLTNYTEHKNWIHFESIYEICRMKGWDAKFYLEGQFERAKNWVKMKYPMPNQLYSEKALRFHIRHLGDIKLKYEKDVGGDKKERGSETTTLRKQVFKGIVASVDILDGELNRNKMDDRVQQKALIIFNHWEKLSAFYLWSIPWFHDVLFKDIDTRIADSYRAEFRRIHNSPSLQRMIAEAVQETEREFSIPPNMTF